MCTYVSNRYGRTWTLEISQVIAFMHNYMCTISHARVFWQVAFPRVLEVTNCTREQTMKFKACFKGAGGGGYLKQ